ncbi:MAG TPA: Hpt domain-containing protein [Thermoanaerobaculia bacterium]|nr:Hpt domain-containing protein [Thermoanaerobaculia bacterium]
MEPDELRQYFAGRLPHRLAEIEDACRAARDAGWTGEPLRTFHRLVHSLTGAGATFGFPEVSEIARGLEHLLAGLLKRDTPPGEPQIGEIEDFLAGLRPVG